MTDTCWLCGAPIRDGEPVIGVVRWSITRVAHRRCLATLAELELDLLRADDDAGPGLSHDLGPGPAA